MLQLQDTLTIACYFDINIVRIRYFKEYWETLQNTETLWAMERYPIPPKSTRANDINIEAISDGHHI